MLVIIVLGLPTIEKLTSSSCNCSRNYFSLINSIFGLVFSFVFSSLRGTRICLLPSFSKEKVFSLQHMTHIHWYHITYNLILVIPNLEINFAFFIDQYLVSLLQPRYSVGCRMSLSTILTFQPSLQKLNCQYCHYQ